MKKKVGLLVGYNGEGYHGLQFNKELKTIEKEVVKILLKNECITELNSHDPQKIDLKSSSRTDKGVHASFNVIAVKIIKEPNEELFKKLKNDFNEIGIVLYKIVVLPKSFVSYKQARSRVYKYIVPTYFLHESNFEQEWKDLKLRDEAKNKNNSTKDLKINNTEEDELENEENSTQIEGFFRTYTEQDIIPIIGYKSQSIQIFREMMEKYVGTHNFHNFTLKRVSGDVKRFMMSITVSEPFYKDDIEYVEVRIHGQSFLLHQIRKMISFAVLNSRFGRKNFQGNFFNALSTLDVHVPKCPSEYLFLSQVFFDDFNLKRKESGQDQIDINENEKEEFEKERIYPSILSKDNLYEWFKYLDAVRFHHDKFEQFNN